MYTLSLFIISKLTIFFSLFIGTWTQDERGAPSTGPARGSVRSSSPLKSLKKDFQGGCIFMSWKTPLDENVFVCVMLMHTYVLWLSTIFDNLVIQVQVGSTFKLLLNSLWSEKSWRLFLFAILCSGFWSLNTLIRLSSHVSLLNHCFFGNVIDG